MKKFYLLFFLSIILINISRAQQGIDTVDVSSGWNLIGALSYGAKVDIISTEPPNIIISPMYGYTPGGSYYQADSLNRGDGYWVKVNQDGKIIYLSFTACGTVNYSGKIYNTVVIGNQCWLKENLDVGTMIDSLLDATDNGVIEKYCYRNDPANCNIYGGLYQWDETMQYSTTPGTQGICPPGWHLPTFTEFQTLIAEVGNDGNALKAIGQGTGGGAGTNTSGFSALLAGYRYVNGNFLSLGNNTIFWSSTETSSAYASDLGLYYNGSGIGLNGSSKTNGISVRCLKD